MRIKRGFKARRRRNRILKIAKGFRGKPGNCYRRAAEAVDRALMQSSKDRRVRRRDFRRLWITRINAAARLVGTTYSRLIHGLTSKNIRIDRKMLADLAVNDFAAFEAVAKTAAA